MPEYLAPGVYVEETSFRAKSIEGVSTSIAGFVGPTRYGPVGGEPEILTSYTEFERMYGGIDRLRYVTGDNDQPADDPTQNFLAHAARAFFANGGTKLYVTRIYRVRDNVAQANRPTWGHGRLDLPDAANREARLAARFPGDHGNLTVRFEAKLTGSVLFEETDDDGNTAPQVRGVRTGDAVILAREDDADPHGIFTATEDGNGDRQFEGGGNTVALADLDPDTEAVHLLRTGVLTQGSGRFDDETDHGEFTFAPDRPDSIGDYFQMEPESRRLRLSLPVALTESPDEGGRLAELFFPELGGAIQAEHEVEADNTSTAQERRDARLATSRAMGPRYHLDGGHDGQEPTPVEYEGEEQDNHKVGLRAFTDVEDIAIVAAPGYSARYPGSVLDADQIQQHLLAHCNEMRYRVAVLDAGPGMTVGEVRDQRARIDSTRAALYYPWITVVDPLATRGTVEENRELQLPPSGFVAGIYARNDVERGVHKAPANEVVQGAVGLEVVLSKGQQDLLNPDGVNAFRFFEGRGYRLWGARTVSSDPEWKYVNVRRYFLYLERSIEKGTQWAVFENNSHQLWGKVVRTIEDFLFTEWNSGALFGQKPEEAYFVRCDRSTMTQNDIDNGRLICLIGVAPVKPAEFVIFRIGQWTADARR